MAPCLGTRVLSARRKWILLAEPLLRRSAMEGPPSSANADGSSTPYEILSSFSLATNRWGWGVFLNPLLARQFSGRLDHIAMLLLSLDLGGGFSVDSICHL